MIRTPHANATHEAGHAIIGAVCGLEILHLEIKTGAHVLHGADGAEDPSLHGFCMAEPHDRLLSDAYRMTPAAREIVLRRWPREFVLADGKLSAAFCFAGHSAEKMLLGGASLLDNGALSDLMQVHELGKALGQCRELWRKRVEDFTDSLVRICRRPIQRLATHMERNNDGEHKEVWEALHHDRATIRALEGHGQLQDLLMRTGRTMGGPKP